MAPPTMLDLEASRRRSSSNELTAEALNAASTTFTELVQQTVTGRITHLVHDFNAAIARERHTGELALPTTLVELEERLTKFRDEAQGQLGSQIGTRVTHKRGGNHNEHGNHGKGEPADETNAIRHAVDEAIAAARKAMGVTEKGQTPKNPRSR